MTVISIVIAILAFGFLAVHLIVIKSKANKTVVEIKSDENAKENKPRRVSKKKLEKELRQKAYEKKKREEYARLKELPPNTYELNMSIGSVCTPCRHTYVNEKILELQNAILDMPWNQYANKDAIEKKIITSRWNRDQTQNYDDDYRAEINLFITPTVCGHGFFVVVKRVSSFISERYKFKNYEYRRHYSWPSTAEKCSEILTDDIEEAKESAALLASEFIAESWA